MTISQYHHHHIPNQYLTKWQTTIDIMARIFDVPAGLIMRVWPSEIEVLLKSDTEGNPYEKGEKAPLKTGLYCETVMSEGKLLHVPNALETVQWRSNPDMKLNMIMYLGVPLEWPDGEIFGTICVLDDKTRQFTDDYYKLMWEFKKIIEGDFQNICTGAELTRVNAFLTENQAKLNAANKELEQRNQDLQRFNRAMIDREMRILELKEEVNQFCEELGQEIIYPSARKDQ